MDMSMARGKPRLRLSPTTMVDSMVMDLDTMEDMAMDMSMARGKPRLKLSPTTMVDSMAMDLDTMEDMATDMSMARGKPMLRLSPTTMVESMAMALDTMEDMAMDMSMARGKLKPRPSQALLWWNLWPWPWILWRIWPWICLWQEGSRSCGQALLLWWILWSWTRILWRIWPWICLWQVNISVEISSCLASTAFCPCPILDKCSCIVNTLNVCFCSIGYKTVNYTKSILPNMLSPSKTCYCTSMCL